MFEKKIHTLFAKER